MAVRVLGIVIFVMLAVFTLPADAVEPAIPSFVWETCSRYPTIEVNALGTTVTFVAKDDPQKLCAVFFTPSATVANNFAAALANLKLVLFRWGCWEVTPSYESVAAGPFGPVIIVRCERGGKSQEFLVGYQNGIVIGYRVRW